MTKGLIVVPLLLVPLSSQAPKPATPEGQRQTANERFAEKMVVLIGDPFSAQVTQVRNLTSSERVGFSKAKTLYHVSVSGPKATYDVYCVEAAPVAGTTYTAHIDYLDGSLSFLRLWPEEKKTLNLPPGRSTKGRAYRMMIFRDFTSDPRRPPDLACDIKTETARVP
jgi:hypothetical protein